MAVGGTRGWRTWAQATAVAVLVIGGWQALVTVYSVPAWKLPAPWAIAQELADSRSLYLRHTWVTLQEVLLGFAVALTFGVSLAGLIASSATFRRAIYPFVIASQTVPIIVIAPLLLVWIGYGVAPKVIVVTLIAFFPIVVNTVDGLGAADADMVRMMRTLGATRSQIFMKVRAPAALPFLFSGIKIAITFSVIGAVIGEWVGASAGLGYLTRVSVPLFQTARAFGAVVILSAMGVTLFSVVALMERRLLPWYFAPREAGEGQTPSGI